MAVLFYPDRKLIEKDEKAITAFLQDRGIHYEKWHLEQQVPKEASNDEVLKLYEPFWKRYCELKGYQTVDVINVTENTPNLDMIRQKFLSEHTHTEDEVRFFVYGQGLFWFHHQGEVFSILCEQGDLLSVPTLYTHWFDMGPHPDVKVIRMFTDPGGWVAHYTQSHVDEKYNSTFPWHDFAFSSRR